jgi:leucyl-tRNA synthetase
MKKYTPKDIEPKWQKTWADNKTYEVTEDATKQKLYASPMLPYPSGTGLHTGHVRNYSITDAVARFYRQKGLNVMSNIAWDSFGLPAENFAIKTGTPPAVSTAQNIAYFKEQLQTLGMSYDWSREFNTSEPSYYKWTQWVFTQLYKQGLAYQAEKPQWWCDKCKTVLADEQVIAGKCWRHDSADDPLVSKRQLRQWFFKITAYADEILDTTDALNWPEKIKTMQKNWIGRSEGAEVQFAVEGSDVALTVFTTRPDTLFGATFLVLAPEHSAIASIACNDQKQAVETYVQEALRKSDVDRMVENREKTGVFTGAYAVNPANNEKVPIWVADYVLGGYGTGAIMAVPAHDDRDFEFAKQFDLPVKQVMVGTEPLPFAGEGVMMNSGDYDNMPSSDVRERLVSDLETRGIAKERVQYKIRDWLISRQRYWGAPVPIIHCPEHGAVAVPTDQLPVALPEVENYAPDGTNHSVLAGVESWVNTTCPTCGGPAKRETDVLDGYVCSSWYLYRYTDAHNDSAAFDPAKVAYWMPLDFYFGGDHAVAHLMHIRFLQRAFIDGGVIDMQDREPVKRLVYNGYINAEDGTKMSKSKGNTVDPMDIIKSGYGADALRVFELFIAPYDQDTPWNTNGVPGAYRFLNRVWTLVQEYLDRNNQKPSDAGAESGDQYIKQAVAQQHRTTKFVTQQLEELSFNTAIAGMMSAVNDYYKLKIFARMNVYENEWKSILDDFVQLLAPFAPHIAEEMWQLLGHEDSVHIGHWPVSDEAHLEVDTITLAVQVNGKVRAEITFAANTSKEEVIAAGLAHENVQKHLENKEPTKTIYVPGRILNFVG